jgi:hypothetical protein
VDDGGLKKEISKVKLKADVQIFKTNTSEINMPTKLTLRLDETLIAAAKAYARTQGRSVSVLVADYFAQLTHDAPPVNAQAPTSKITASLRGALQGSDLDQSDYHRYLEAKHQ